ncbi:MAG: YraN family protein [Desulfobacteraceae bacterium]|nr:YraN family protein [Desulfobacteraceae bacterium]
MKDRRKLLGDLGETAAQKFLSKKRYKILERNFRTRFAEIDIIAQDEDVLCFIEVKTRTNINKILPRQSVNLAKQKKIIQGALTYIKKKNYFQSRMRFDVIEVHEHDGKFNINLIKNAFQAR